jgi:heat-inducible transcriptional repressor
VEKHTIELAEPVGEERIGAASAHLASHLGGAARSGLGAVPATGDGVLDTLCDRAMGSLRSALGEEPDQVFVGGTSQVARAFDAIETVREVLGVLEQQYVVVTLLRDVLDRGLQVAIGTETGMAPLAECALIVAPYQVEGEPAGSIGVLGPSRMDYPQAMAAVAVVSHRLSQRLTEG